MLYNYYKTDRKLFKIIDFFKEEHFENSTNKSIRKKIKKLNDYNFFILFCQIIYYIPINNLTKKQLAYFFNEKQKTYDNSGYLDFEDTSERNIIVETYITFNCKSEIVQIVNYLINTQEYPKQYLVAKLLAIKDRIIEENIPTLIYVKESFINYCDNQADLDEFEKIKFSLDIIGKLNDFEIDLFELVDEIDLKIKYLNSSIPIQGNYLIDINNDFLIGLYLLLEKYMFIDQNKTSQEQFIHVLKSNWEDHKSIIYLEMDSIQFNYFLVLLEENFKIKIQLSSIEYSGNIKTKNKTVKAYSVSSSYSQAKRKGTEPKRKKDILSIIEKLKMRQ